MVRGSPSNHWPGPVLLSVTRMTITMSPAAAEVVPLITPAEDRLRPAGMVLGKVSTM